MAHYKEPSTPAKGHEPEIGNKHSAGDFDHVIRLFGKTMDFDISASVDSSPTKIHLRDLNTERIRELDALFKKATKLATLCGDITEEELGSYVRNERGLHSDRQFLSFLAEQNPLLKDRIKIMETYHHNGFPLIDDPEFTLLSQMH